MKGGLAARATRGRSRLIWDGLIAAAALAALVISVAPAHAGPSAAGAGAGPPSPMASLGMLSGGISPCEGIPIPGPTYAAGTVVVLQGTVGWRSVGPGTWASVFPTRAVATETVGVDETYTFRLAPGRYVLVGHYPPPTNVTPWVEVSLHAGQVVRADIPNMCM